MISGRQIVLGYVAREGQPGTRTVHPLGLATKGGSWYLIGETEAVGAPSVSTGSNQSRSPTIRSFGRTASSWPTRGR